MATSKYTYGEIESIDAEFNKLADRMGIPKSTSYYLKSDVTESYGEISEKDRNHAKELYNKYSYNKLSESMGSSNLSERAIKQVACVMNRPVDYIKEALMDDEAMQYAKSLLKKD